MRQFNAVVSEKVGTAHTNYEQIIDGDKAWVIPPTLWIDKTEREILSVIKPLLYVAKELTIADPYFKLPGNNLLKAILKSAKGSGVRKVTIATSMECGNLVAVFQREYKKTLSEDIKLIYVRLPDQFIHDRYILTDTAAIKAGQGFAVAPEKGLQSDHLSVSLCGFEEYKDTKTRIEQFQQQKPESCQQLG
jgi:hypothetical protein